MAEGENASRTVIVGGGLAGLAAAEGLSRHGVPVTVLEARPRLGGRAASFDDAATGRQIDNCQHVSMGCCTNFRHWCEQTGIAHQFRTERVLNFVGNDGRVRKFGAGPYPTPLHLLPGFLNLDYLSLGERFRIGTALRALARENIDDSQSFLDWLRAHQQSDAAIERFWLVVLVSALSESLDRIAVRYARKVFVDGFLRNRHGWEVQVPTAPLDELYGQAVTECLQQRGADIQLKSGVKRLQFEQGSVSAVELRDGSVIQGDNFVLAVPQYLVASLVQDNATLACELASLEKIETAPITSVHLWFDRPVTELPHAVLIERVSQWMFNRTLLQGETDSTSQYLQIVISASRAMGKSDELLDTVINELHDLWPQSREAVITHSRVVTEHKAVFSVTPGIDQYRLPQQTSIPNLQLAGDWTQTGWPATMEGAVRSGYLAAENVLSQLGRPATLLQPDLPVGRLAGLLYGNLSK
ncbi:hydroxysqualene dehydroxylase HpnE [Calycomorphotria hydatis]|uniref:15-cis-phytoene desaturase n=1 Tax=Calycomorphotria hydatis TaxID=2528027 RepID=A0A517TCL4_9PLAN|nr:hydroxysqualene dehydroxylase HpnE [Calycomorphotria hydatis]QDT66112.1 15-cis-phytoene desaturase [Calycomorphotria hydatis]